MESNLGLMLEHNWDFYMDFWMVLIMESSGAYCLDTHCDLQILIWLDLMKELIWYILKVKVIGAMLGHLCGINFGSDVGTALGSLDWSVYSSNDGNLLIALLWVSLWYTDGKVLGSDESIKMQSTSGKIIGIILVNVDGIKLRFDFGTEMDSLDRSFDSYDSANLRSCFLKTQWDVLMVKCLALMKTITLGLSDGNVLGAIL